jgi:hypothetical protein
VGTNAGALAGYFQGNVQAFGTLTASGSGASDGLVGLQTATAQSLPITAGVYAESTKSGGTALYAMATNNAGTAISAYAPQGDAAFMQGNVYVIGRTVMATESGTALNASTDDDDAIAIHGESDNDSYAIGVEGETAGGIGVKGVATDVNGWGVWGVATNVNALAGYFQGNVQVDGTTTTKVLTITGGADVAEPFNISSSKNEIPQGAVVVIDPQNPGHLKLSENPYDTRVAGVISGANGISPGIQMHQQGLSDGGWNVALTGRVYVQADTSNGAIEPGDLLTTSSTPGHAMKVTDHTRAAGAILGKAMTALTSGRGMVLVLVTLQ